MSSISEDGSICTTIQLRFDRTSHQTVRVVPLSARRYRLEETPLFTESLHPGDVIEAELLPDRTHRFIRMLEPAPMRHHSWIVGREWIESPTGEAYIEAVEAAGGSWEQVFGGVLFVHIPSESPFDAQAELDRYMGLERPQA